MKFLVDENLPVDLAAWLRRAGFEARHVRETGLARAPDRQIALRARRERDVIITQDRDIADAGGGDPAFWLQVVWVRLGNASIDHLLKVWAAEWGRVRAELDEGRELVELVD